MISEKLNKIFRAIDVKSPENVGIQRKVRNGDYKKYTLEELKSRVFSDKSLNQYSYSDIINFNRIHKNPEFYLNLNRDERASFFCNTSYLVKALKKHSDNLSNQIKTSTDKKEIRRLENERRKAIRFQNKIEDSLQFLRKNIAKYSQADQIAIAKEPSYRPGKNEHMVRVQDYITDVLYDVQKFPVEFGGGYSSELKFGNVHLPEKIVMRKFKPTRSQSDTRSDVEIHTHPKRYLSYKHWSKDFLNLYEQIQDKYRKVKDFKTQNKIWDIEYKINSALDYLPSGQDVSICKDSGGTSVVVSDSGSFVMTKDPQAPYEKLDPSLIEKKIVGILEYALVKSKLNKKIGSIRELNRRADKYNEIIIDTYRKLLEENGLRSEFYPKHTRELEYIETRDKEWRYKRRKIEDELYDMATPIYIGRALKRRHR